VGEYPDVRRLFLPMQCMHCASPPCVPVCPTGASRQRDDGIVWVEYDACVGCGYCAMACPYQARHLVDDVTGYFEQETDGHGGPGLGLPDCLAEGGYAPLGLPRPDARGARAQARRPSTPATLGTPAERALAQPARHGVMTKCTFCKDRVDAGLARGLAPGVDADATPMCAVACIAGAIVFGDLDDERSAVSRLRRDGRATPLMPECGTEPRVYYRTE
jgi:phenylacetyl-CoA:acceptor oxidoreductase subunit 1